MAQFEEATAAVEASKNEKKRGGGGGDVPADEDRRKKISLFEATNSLMEGQSAEAMGGIVREDWSRAPALVRTLPFLRPKLKTPELQAQRDRLLALARTPMDRSPLHERVLMSVFRTITKEDTLPPRFGPRWETVGFQGDDPATDLRGSGMLALLQMLHMGAKRPKLVAELYALSQGGTAFPLMTCSINFTQVAMQALRSGSLTKDANKAKTLYEPFHAFHAACMLHMMVQWRRRGLGIQDFGFLRKEIETLALQKPGKLTQALKQYELGPSKNLSAGQIRGQKPGDFVDFS